MTADTEGLAARVARLEAMVEELDARLDRAVNRDIPLLKGTVRAALDAEIDDIGELPAAGRQFNRQCVAHAERIETLEQRVAALGDIETAKTTKEQKLAAICTFAQNKRGTQSSTVAVTASEIQGCVGVSRRYAYELIEAAPERVEGMRVREATEVQTSTGVEHRKKALLVDCEAVHTDQGTVNSFTTRNGDAGYQDTESVTLEEVD